MNRRSIIIAAFIVAATIAPSAEAASKPTLAVVSKQPLVIRGMGFHSGERMTVTALTPIGVRVVNVEAGLRGGFRVTFRLPSQPCASPFAVRARGASGQVATIWFETQACTPPPLD